MTRLPGIDLTNSDDDELELEIEDPWLWELKECITAMRQWRSPYDNNICSAIGNEIHSIRVPGHTKGPFSNQTELNENLFRSASSLALGSMEAYDEALAIANELRHLSHEVKFTHGDLKAHDILVGDYGHLSGFLDWESGGWYPEYWEFTTAMRWDQKSWWGQTAAWLGGNAYLKELRFDEALTSLTANTISFWLFGYP